MIVIKLLLRFLRFVVFKNLICLAQTIKSPNKSYTFYHVGDVLNIVFVLLFNVQSHQYGFLETQQSGRNNEDKP